MIIKNAVLATPIGTQARRGSEQNQIKTADNAVVVIEGNQIVYAGEQSQAPTYIHEPEELDACGRLVTPGLVDAHTHSVFGGWRQHELTQKLAGAAYIDILKSGGGILSTVESTRAADEAELTRKTQKLLALMLAHGTTTCEAKSGYGLDLENEIKQLSVLKNLNESTSCPISIVPTFMGAHAFPKEYGRNEYIELLTGQMIPQIAGLGLAEFCDIFCENAVFTVEDSRKVMRKAREYGFSLKIHADEIESGGGAELAAELGAISAEHLIRASDEGIRAMAEAGVIAVLLPATSFYLDKPYARARTMLENGLAVAVASDFNPGSSPNFNLQFAMTLACLKYRLAPAACLTAVTLNAAAAINRAQNIGTLEEGKLADIVIWDAPDLDFLFYRYGNNQAAVVIKNGKVAYSALSSENRNKKQENLNADLHGLNGLTRI